MRLHLSSTPHWFYLPSFFLVTFFCYGIFQLPSFAYFELFPFSKYTAMALPSRANRYYCELYSRTLVPVANLKEHKVGAIHRGLLEASRKMTKRQLQMFREDLKVAHCKQKLPAKRTILEALGEPVEPNNWCVPFFLSIVFYRVFFFYYDYFLTFFSFFCLLPHDSVCDQQLHRPTFSLRA